MRTITAFIFFMAAILLMVSCDKQDTAKPAVNPTIQFRTWEGFTYRDDTVGQGDTVRIGVLVDRGTAAMHHFKVTVSYDGASPQVTDSLPMGTDSFEFEKVVITRMQSGTERWSFNVVENDGDVIRRALTLTVQ
jgi:hypothetical protein